MTSNYQEVSRGKKNKLARSDVAIHLTLPYTLATLLYLIFNKIIYNHVGGWLVFAFLEYWGPTDYVYGTKFG